MENKIRFKEYRMIGLSIKAVISAVPVAAVYVMAYLFLSSLSGAVTGLLLEKLTNAVLLKESTYFVYIVGYVIFFVVLQLAGFAYAIAMNTFVFEKVSDELNRRLADTMVQIEYFNLERKEKLDEIYRARECIEDERIPDCFMQTIRLMGTIVALISAFSVASTWNILIPIILVLFFIPEMLIRKKGVQAEQNEKNKTVTLEREKNDLWKVFFRKEAAKELKVFQTGKWMIQLWKEKSVYLLFRQWKIRKTTINYLMWAQLFKVAGLIVCFGFIAIACFRQELLAGALAGALSLLPAIQNSLTELGERSWNLKKNLLYTECYFNIINVGTKKPKVVLNVNDRIEGKNIVFGYDDKETNVLDGVSFTIRKGEKVALVGENGAGKTTLIKCLLGLYPLKSGNITYDGVPINAEIDCDYRNISIMSHEFGKYCLTVAENIGFDHADNVQPEKLLMEDCFLGKEYGGKELSGGQWQKVALYRCLYKNAEFYILDEPTAYLDPSYEADAVTEILNELNDKTVLIITHRIGICRLMDQVIVMGKDHKIAGSGKHEDLLNICSIYRKLYESQAEWYR